MRPLKEWQAHDVRGLLFDVDDTLTTEGRLTSAAFAAMERLYAAGKLVVPITGRPAGWCDQIARLWPVHAVVGENGAFYFQHDQGRLLRRFQDPEAVRLEKRARLAAIARQILAAVPGCAVASDQPYREDVAALSLAQAEHIAELMRQAGLVAKISSIHVNGWFGDYDKLTMTRRLFTERFGVDLEQENARYAFVGDSPNDAPMFAFFEHSIAVANVARYQGRLAAAPRYVAPSSGGAGFAEVVDRLLDGN